MQTFAWQGIVFEHPDEWECVRFSKNRQRGECALADPRGQRMSLLWSRVDAKSVDARRILDEAVSQLQKSDPKGAVLPRAWQPLKNPAGWKAIEWRGTEDMTVAVGYFAESGYLLQVQFTADRKNDLAAQRRILESMRCQKTGTAWRWRAFGCDVRLPSEYEVQSCAVFPGRAALAFGTRGRKQQRVKIERFAVPETQLNGRSLKEWFASTLEEPRRILGSDAAAIGGHAGVCVKLKPGRATPLQVLTRVKRLSRVAVWVCECEARLYTAEWEGAADGAPKLEEVVACCGNGHGKGNGSGQR